MFRTTIAGGIVFLLPIIVVVFLLEKGFELARRVAHPLTDAIGLETIGGVAVGTIVTIALMVLIAYLAGLIARTKAGERIFGLLEKTILGVIPQMRMARGFVESFDPEKASKIEVVLVPTDAGWCLGFVLEKPEGDWWSVFVPGAPQWTSGSVVYAHSEQVRHSGMTFPQAIMLMRRCGAGSEKMREWLDELQQQGSIGPL